jgi:hypothetical protein
VAKLEWDKTGKKFFETGIDHGVLYPNNGPGVPWNGLISIEEQVSGGETEAYYFDGIKYFDDVAVEDFQASLRAFTYPDEFAACEGSTTIVPGFVAEYQTRQTFGLAWRTRAGNDVDGVEHGSQIHIVYNATAAPSSKAYETLSDSPTPVEFEWTINAVPPLPGQGLGNSGGDPNVDFLDWMWPPGYGMPGWPKGPDGNTLVDGWWAMPYVVIDEQDVVPDIYISLVDRLNGTPETLPYLPSPLDLVNLLNGFDIPDAPLDPNYVPVDPGGGDGGGNGSGGGSTIGPHLDLVYTETYKGSLEDYPNDSLIPYGPPNLTDNDDATGIVLSSSWAADWFLYFDTTKLDPAIPQFNVKLRLKAPTTTLPMEVKFNLEDVNETMDSKNLSNPDSDKLWSLGGFYASFSGGVKEQIVTIDQAWLDKHGSMLSWFNGTSWSFGPIPYSDLITKMKSAPYAMLHARIWTNRGVDIQILEASINHDLLVEDVSVGYPVQYIQSGNPEWPNPIMAFNDQTHVWSDNNDETFVRTTMYRKDASWGTASSNAVIAPIVGAVGSASQFTSMTWKARVRVFNDADMTTQKAYFDFHDANYNAEIDYTYENIPSDGEWHDISITWTRQGIIDWGTDPDQLWQAMVDGSVVIECSIGGSSVISETFTQQVDFAQLEVTVP